LAVRRSTANLTYIPTTVTLTAPAPSIAAAKSNTLNFLSRHQLASDLLSLKQIQSGYAVTRDQEIAVSVTNQSQAELTYISMQYHLHDVPVFLNPPAGIDVASITTGKNQITSLSINVPPTLSPIGFAIEPDVNEVQVLLNNNQGFLLPVLSPDSLATAKAPNSASSLTLTSAKVAYVFSTSTSTLSPAFLFEGSASDAGGKSFSTLYLLPLPKK